MRKKIISAAFASLFLVAAVAAGYAQGGRHLITGFVFDESRRPATEVFVELLNEYGSPVGRMRVNGSGMYQFRNLQQGNYQVRIVNTTTNYEEQTKSVPLFPLSAGQRSQNGQGQGDTTLQSSGTASEHVDFFLKTRKSQNAAAQGRPEVIFAQSVPEPAKALYEAGLQELAAKNDAVGLRKIKESIELFPDYYAALDKLGTEYVLRGYYEPAYVLFTKAVLVNPKSFSSRFGLGLAQFRLKMVNEAISSFQKSVEINGNSANGHLWLGIALQSVKKLPEALTALLRAEELAAGQSADVHFQLAKVYAEQQKYALAADQLELFLKYRPDAQNVSEIRDRIATLRKKS